ncbi:flagellar biosynthetic protein FliO [Variovorax boronicumulans]|uniref:flagellar biosynthetic protein FliO n=1 Tax=Variovorax boronicumulans TaxID=436515 RepID=UPI0012E492DB|nr:flagellar biosynthetic protein FliO [Variovorax boronicumulans]GER12547.1 flagellar biosynthetic protein FliO [Variovorax boronicumulans]
MNLARVSSLLARSAALLALGFHAAHAALPTVPTPVREAAPPAAVGGAGLLQAGFGMAAVVGLIFLCAWLARRFGLQRLGGGQVVKVVSTAMVGPRERVVVVDVAGQWLVLGVTSSQVRTLHTLPAQATPAAVTPMSPQNPVGLFAQKLRDSLAGKARTVP